MNSTISNHQGTKAPTELPRYAVPYASMKASVGDVGAEFIGDDGGCITVEIERGADRLVSLKMGRSGFNENCFSENELGHVLELAGILFAANGKQPTN